MAEIPADARKGFGLDQSPNELVLGTFDRALTVFDQQVRALNLVHRLHENSCFAVDKPIAVIGAGIAGMTFAAGSLWLGHRVLLLEKQPVPCHLQRGCDIRWIHPHIYHWPRLGSEQPYAGLPLLSWAEGTASEVARQITAEWDRLRPAAATSLSEVYSAQFEFLSKDPLRIKWEGVRGGNQAQDVVEVSHVVYAVGFGVEQGHSAVAAHSYWENDSFNQLRPDHPPGVKLKWLVSGTGDGALIDLQRLTIESFRQRRVVQELFADEGELVGRLRALAAQASLPNFHQSINALDTNSLLHVDERLRKRRRNDTAVVLNARGPAFDEAINKSNASFLNRFVVHRLYRIRAFEYRSGDLWNIEHRQTARGDSYGVTLVNTVTRVVQLEECDEVVLRHGTQRHTWLERAGYRRCAELEAAVNVEGAGNKPEWDPGWWAKRVEKALLRRLHNLAEPTAPARDAPPDAAAAATGEDVRNDPREFITPVTEAVATTFVRTLAGLVEHSATPEAAGKSFRITLHRVLPLNGKLRLQQISEYAGTRPDDSLERTRVSGEAEGSAIQIGTVGRVFDVNHLTIGLCVRSRRPCLLSSTVPVSDQPAPNLVRDMNALHIDDSYARHMNSTVRAVLTIPFFGATWKIGDKEMVNLVLYIDSDNPGLFSRTIINVVHAACKTFRNHLDELSRYQEGGFRSVSWDLASAAGDDLQPADDVIPNLGTFVDDRALYYNLLKNDNTVDLEVLKFTDLDVVDLVSGMT